MWKRRTYHDCASELAAISEDFRSAHMDRHGWGRERCHRIMLDTSERGVEVLRVVALSVRSDQDYGLTNRDPTPVGALRQNGTPQDIIDTITGYRPPYSALNGFGPINLRQALNKIAHADPRHAGFFADGTTHDLILSGTERGNTWVAVISLLDLCRVIQVLPDARLHQ